MLNRVRCDRLSRYLEENDPDAPLPASLALHASGCERCREARERQFRTDRILRATAGDEAFSQAFEDAGQARLMRAVRESRRREATPGGWRANRLAPALAVSLAATGAWAYFALRPLRRVPPLVSLPPNASSGGSIARSVPAIGSVKRPVGSAPGLIRSHGASPSPSKSFAPGSIARRGNPRESPENPSRRPADSPERAASATDDLAYVNEAARPGFVNPPVERMRPSSARGDDFVTIPPPEIAATPSASTNRLIAEAAVQYEKEKAVVDPRLFQKIDMEMKGGDLKEMVETLTRKTGVRFYVSKDLEEIKLTILIDRTPVRDVMRQVALLFNMEWRRRGEDDRYTYELTQTLKRKLAEEELKRRDEDQMLLDVVDKMDQFLPYKDQSPERLDALATEMSQRAAIAGSAEERKSLLEKHDTISFLANDNFKYSLQAYSLLAPEQLMDLRNGKDITFTYKEDGSESGLPKEWAEGLRRNFASPNQGSPSKDKPSESLSVTLGFKLFKLWPDYVELATFVSIGSIEGNPSRMATLVNGYPDQIRKPGNVAAHASLASRPEWKEKELLSPVSSVSPNADDDPQIHSYLMDMRPSTLIEDFSLKASDWIDSADFYAELHKKTKRNVIADYYTRVYPKSVFESKGERLLDVLNGAGDQLKSEWISDGNFLRFRRLDYYTERMMDVPNRLLTKWRKDREINGYLDLDDLSEIAMLPYSVLTHRDLRRALALKYGFHEWEYAYLAQNLLQFYAGLNPEHKSQVQTEEGLALSFLTPVEREAFKKARNLSGDASDETFAKGGLQFRQTKPESYVWLDAKNDQPAAFPPPLLQFKTKEEAEAAVAKRLASRKFTADEIAAAKARIFGPESVLFLMSQAGDKFYLNRYSNHGMATPSGSF